MMKGELPRVCQNVLVYLSAAFCVISGMVEKSLFEAKDMLSRLSEVVQSCKASPASFHTPG